MIFRRQPSVYLLLNFLTSVCSRKHAIRQKSAELQSFKDVGGTHIGGRLYRDQYLALGEPVAVLAADSRLACAQSCAAVTGCTASMWIANRCNLYAEYRCANEKCPFVLVEETEYLTSTWYGGVVVPIPYTTSVFDVYDTCNVCGTYPVAITSRSELGAVIGFVQENLGVCQIVWTGGINLNGSADPGSWLWYRTPWSYTPMSYTAWAYGEPNNRTGDQYVMGLLKYKDYLFTDVSARPAAHPYLYDSTTFCYLCEFRP